MKIDRVQPHLLNDYDRTMPGATVRTDTQMTQLQRFVRKLKIGY